MMVLLGPPEGMGEGGRAVQGLHREAGCVMAGQQHRGGEGQRPAHSGLR